MRIVITGGHPGPALAVIDHIRSSYPDWKIYFVGTKNPLTDDKALSFEYKEIAARGLPFINLNTGKFDRANKLKLILNSYKIARGYFKSLTILNRIKPDAVLAFGGYLAVPVAFGAKTLGIKVLTHEQTFGVGFANRLIARIADRVLLSWEETKLVDPNWKSVVTGLPIRKSVINAKAQIDKSKLPLILVMGGSQGAHFINQLIGNMLDDLLSAYRVVHQVGDSSVYDDYATLNLKRKEMKQEIGDKYELYKHISTEKIGAWLELADVVISRAGINTVAELLYLQKKAVLIPLLECINPEQLINAKYYKETGLGTYLKQDEVTPDSLHNEINNVMKHNMDESDTPVFRVLEDAASHIVKEIIALTDGQT